LVNVKFSFEIVLYFQAVETGGVGSASSALKSPVPTFGCWIGPTISRMGRCLDSVSNITAWYRRSLGPTIYFYDLMLLQFRLSVCRKCCHTNM